MANTYSDSVLLAARAAIKDPNNKKFQNRIETSQILPVYLKDREFTLPNLAQLRSSTTRATDALYLKRKDFTLGTSKSCTPTGETSGSGKITLSWATKKGEVKTSFKQFAGNEFAQAQVLANDLYNFERSFFFGDVGSAGIESILLAHLEANKSGVNNGGSGIFDAAEDTMFVAAANVDDFYNLVTADMQMNDYMPIFNDVHDTMWTAKQRKYVNQGAGNATNLAFQFAGFEFNPTNKLTTAAIGNNTPTSVHYVLPEQAVAILDWNDPLNVKGAATGDREWTTYQSILFPEFTFDVLKYKTCADTSADGGGTQDLVEVWEMSFNYALAVQPVAGVGETPIFKYATLGSSYVS